MSTIVLKTYDMSMSFRTVDPREALGWGVGHGAKCSEGSVPRGSPPSVVSHRPTRLVGRDERDGAEGVLAAADAVGAPLSVMLVRHEPAMDVTVPGWLVDQVGRASRRWGSLRRWARRGCSRRGTQRLLAGEQADRPGVAARRRAALGFRWPRRRRGSTKLRGLLDAGDPTARSATPGTPKRPCAASTTSPTPT